MKADVLTPQDISDLEHLLIRNGKIVPIPAAALMEFGQNALSLFCLKHGIYQIPTTELIKFLQKEIGAHKAIEIGSGNGCIGRALKIPMTDNRMQEWPEMKAYYEALGQPPVKYGDDVKGMAAIPAVKHYHPTVVVACWVTHLFKPGMKVGNAHGVDEELLFGHGVDKYIHVGNKRVHQEKPILRKSAHFDIDIISPEWLLSRSMSPEDNQIYIISKRN